MFGVELKEGPEEMVAEMELIIRPHPGGHPTYIVSVSARSRVTHCVVGTSSGEFQPEEQLTNRLSFHGYQTLKGVIFALFLLKHMHPCACAVPYHGE